MENGFYSVHYENTVQQHIASMYIYLFQLMTRMIIPFSAVYALSSGDDKFGADAYVSTVHSIFSL